MSMSIEILELSFYSYDIPDSKVHVANMGPILGGRTQVDPMLTPWTLFSGIRINLARGSCNVNMTLITRDVIKSNEQVTLYPSWDIPIWIIFKIQSLTAIMYPGIFII